tara:strand:+ start:584 stop:1696 length:1113 start_codon:yes stop_codon:yes gene_type:complete
MATIVRSAAPKAQSAASYPGYLSLSSTGPVSGVSAVGYFSGPHYVETQSLTITYKRMPHFHFSHGSLNLSAGNLSPTIAGTYLALQVSPIVTREKVYDWYETSSYTQPQRFTVYSASADYNGKTYGTPAAGTLCVQGNILTTQPWYFRRPWTAADDVTSQSWTPEPGVRLETRLHPHPDSLAFGPGLFGEYGSANTAYSYRPIARHGNNCIKDSLLAVGEPNNTPQDSFNHYGLYNRTFWDSVAGKTAANNQVQVNGTLNWSPPGSDQQGEFCYQATHISNATYYTPSFLQDNHQLGFKSGAYGADQDSTGDIQVLVDEIADIIAKDWNDGSSSIEYDYFVGTCLHQPFQNKWMSLANQHYSKSRHYWGN